MLARKRAHAVIRQKFGLVQHTSQQTFHAVSAQQREQPPLAQARYLPVRDELGEFRAIVQIPFETTLEFRHLVQQLGIEGLDCKQGNETDH